jgi:acetyl esterase
VPIDPQLESYLANAFAVHELPVEDARAMVEQGATAMFGEKDAVGAVVDRTLPAPVRVRIYEPPGARPERGFPVLVYFHGGGWVVGSLDTHDGVCRALCARTPCVVVAVDYRLAPEHRYPAAVEDAWAATAWVAEHAASIGGDASRIAAAGDSAGGALAAAVAQRARAYGLALRHQLLIYPVLDYELGTDSYSRNGDGYGLSRDAMQWYWQQYLGPEGHDRGSEPEASPLRASDLSGLAPAFVATCEYDPLLDEGEAYARRLADAGVPVRLQRYDGMIHGFVRMGALVDRAQGALDDCAAALADAFS